MIVEKVRSVIGDEPAVLHAPYFKGNEQKYVSECIASGHVSAGKWVERFEAMLCEATGARYAIAMCSGTAALHAAYSRLFNIVKTVVPIPALTFVATANALNGISEFKFVEPENASIGVHVLGHRAVTKAHIYDAAQALGTEGLSGIRIFSFNQNKIITTGGGGAVVTDHEGFANGLRHLITTARVPHPYKVEHDRIGFNYRMPDLNAALGCAQLEQLPHILKLKRALAMKYKETFGDVFIDEPEGTKSNFWLNAIRVKSEEQVSVLKALNAAGYQSRMLPTPLHLLPMYQNYPRDDLSASEEIWRTTICLPSSPKLGERYA